MYSRYDGVDEQGWTFDDVLGWQYVPFDPWIWSFPAQGWLYVGQPPSADGAWVYALRTPDAQASGDADIAPSGAGSAHWAGFAVRQDGYVDTRWLQARATEHGRAFARLFLLRQFGDGCGQFLIHLHKLVVGLAEVFPLLVQTLVQCL